MKKIDYICEGYSGTLICEDDDYETYDRGNYLIIDILGVKHYYPVSRTILTVRSITKADVEYMRTLIHDQYLEKLDSMKKF